MLSFHGQPQRFCDGYTRREMLQVGCTGMAGLALPSLLRAEAEAGIGSSEKSMIHIVLPGGPPHTDMFDMKPNAPDFIRGEFKPISTQVAGIQYCELLPKLAAIADKLAVVRSIGNWTGAHGVGKLATGGGASLAQLGGRPSQSAIVSKLKGSIDGTIPPSILIHHGGGSGDANYDPTGFLGQRYAAFQPNGSLSRLMKLGISRDRLANRQRLAQSLDNMRREADATGVIAATDTYTQRAFDILFSSKLSGALSINDEPPEVIERYGAQVGQWGHTMAMKAGDYGSDNQDLIRARRLIEAGGRMVSVFWGHWDTHWNNFPCLREMLPAFDAGLSALVTDLIDRGLYENTAIVVWGEFGRTPRIYIDPATNGGGPGRGHHPAAGMAMILGGGMRMGQMIGETDKHGATQKRRRLEMQNVLATMYHHIGLDPRTTQIIDPAGRPQYLIEHNQPIRELI